MARDTRRDRPAEPDGFIGRFRARPSILLWLAVVAVAIGVITILVSVSVGRNLAMAAVGYLLSSVVAITLVVLFRQYRREKQAESNRAAPAREVNIARATLVVGLLVAAGNAYLIAEAFA